VVAGSTSIEWTDATWNPIVGCTIVSPGCTNCYAMKWAHARLDQPHNQFPHYRGTTRKVNGNAVWTGKVAMAPDHILTAPLHWKKPKRVFVNSMGDLFHESIPDDWIDRVFAVMALCPRHTFQVLTKRSARLRAYMEPATGIFGRVINQAEKIRDRLRLPAARYDMDFSNVWLGVSAEDQARADERIPDLLATPAAVRFISAEPLLGPINLDPFLHDSNCEFAAMPADYGSRICICSEPREVHLDWVIAGSESGNGARLPDHRWFRSIKDQCVNADIPFFLKQFADANGRKIHTPQLDGRQWLQFPKHTAGRTLDGTTHDAFPEPQS